jgi:hypothetical protein
VRWFTNAGAEATGVAVARALGEVEREVAVDVAAVDSMDLVVRVVGEGALARPAPGMSIEELWLPMPTPLSWMHKLR